MDTKVFTVELTVDADVTKEALHEALCKILHEGYAVDDKEGTGLEAEWLLNVGTVVEVPEKGGAL